MSAQAEHAGQSMQTLFYQYMFVLRAEENDRKTTIPGLRKWFSEKEFQRLRSGRVLEDLDRILNVWKVAINHEGIEGEPWSDDEAIRQALDILMDYPNEFWKYPTVIYYLKHHDEGDFAVRFLAFLRHLTAALVSRFAISPSVNSVKQRVLNLDAEILKSKEPRFDFKDVDTEELASKLREPHYRLVRMLLKVIAYHDPEQCGLLPERWEIEHIFPQKWDDMKFPSLSNDEVKVAVIHAGVGGITESDVMLAAASNALIIGFNIRPDKKALDAAARDGVDIRTYRIIYECIEEIEAAMKGMLAPKFRENVIGHAEVRQTIRVPNVGTIAGSYVTDGKIARHALIRVLRDNVVIFEDKIASLKRFKDDAREVAQSFECGVGLEKFNDIKVGDVLEAYVMEEIEQ